MCLVFPQYLEEILSAPDFCGISREWRRRVWSDWWHTLCVCMCACTCVIKTSGLLHLNCLTHVSPSCTQTLYVDSVPSLLGSSNKCGLPASRRRINMRSFNRRREEASRKKEKEWRREKETQKSNMRASERGSPGIRTWICIFTWELQFWISSLGIICHGK